MAKWLTHRTGKKYEGLCPTSHNVQKPVVKLATYGLIEIEGDHLSLVNDVGQEKNDVKLPGPEYTIDPELGEKIKKALQKLEDADDDGLFVNTARLLSSLANSLL